MLRDVPELWKFCSHFSEKPAENCFNICFHLLLFAFPPLRFSFALTRYKLLYAHSSYSTGCTGLVEFPRDALRIVSSPIPPCGRCHPRPWEGPRKGLLWPLDVPQHNEGEKAKCGGCCPKRDNGAGNRSCPPTSEGV